MMLSLITSLYHSERYLKSFLKRLPGFVRKCHEGGVDIELVLVFNDITKDEEWIIGRSKFIKKLSDNRVKIVKVPRESLYATWNRGVQIAGGEWVGFWNVDDIRFSSAIVSGRSMLGDMSVDLVYFPYIYIRGLSLGPISFPIKIKKVIPPQFTQSEFVRSMHCGPFFIFRKDFYRKIGKFDEQLLIAGDFDWCTRGAESGGNYKLHPQVAGLFFNDGKSLSGSRNPRQFSENNIVYQRRGIVDKIVKGIID